MKLMTYQPTSASPDEFVEYWSKVYPEQEDADLYRLNIGHLSQKALQDLFLWKFGLRFAVTTRKAVEKEIIPRLDELNTLPNNLGADVFLRRFSKGGAVFRIFLLHCWRHKRFPIYDQHVHRAMSAIKFGQCEEIGAWSDKEKVASYLDDYLAFHRAFAGSNERRVDMALWAFGKFIKTSRLPMPLSRNSSSRH